MDINPSVEQPLKKVKGKRIKNIYYVEFLEKGIIQYINEEHIIKASNNIKGKYKEMGKALLYLAYLTGARPCELLILKAKDIVKEQHFIKVTIGGAKNGLTRPVYLKLNNDFVKFIWNYANSLMPDIYLFWGFKGSYKRQRLNKRGVVKEYNEISRPFRYWVNSWFKGVFPNNIVPYHFRHNRFSKLSEKGVSMEDLRLLKGSKTLASVIPYIHLSSSRGKKIAKDIQ